VARSRAARDRIGFGREPAARGAGGLGDGIAVSFTAEEVEQLANFQAFGFLPELLARFSRFVPFAALDAGTLMDILRTHVTDKLTREFDAEGFALVVEPEVLDHVVAEGLRRETGARGLTSVLTRHLERAAFDAFAESAGGEVRLSMSGSEITVDV